MNRFAVNRETNKQWRYRIVLVEELAAWVYENLNPDPPDYGGHESSSSSDSEQAGPDKKSTHEGKVRKAHQYVYEFLAVGKMLHPRERHDPLFTYADYEDKSMQTQLARGMYERFIEQVREKQQKLHIFRVESEPDVTWRELERDMLRPTRDLLAGIRRDLERRSRGRNRDWVDQQMIGLVLRYKCVGAFSNNLHGSVPGTWGHELGPVEECFASPFNHKFETYFSMFDQDSVFGSQGNFFSAVDSGEGMLPERDVFYEMNPPWNNQMYEKVNEIMRRTLQAGRRVRVVIVGPKWKHTRWIPGFRRLLLESEAYHAHSLSGKGLMWYQNDATGKRFPQKTVYWIFSAEGLLANLPERLGLPPPRGKPERARHTARTDTLFPYTMSLLLDRPDTVTLRDWWWQQ